MNEPPVAPEPVMMTLIARDIATEARTLEQSLVHYQIDRDYFDSQIAPNPYYQRVLADYTKEWQSLGSTQKRLAFSALAALEEHLPVLANRMGSRQSALADSVAAAKLFRELAGIAPPTSQPGAGSSTPFSISINFGSHKVALETRPETPSEESLLQTISGEALPAPSKMVSQHAEESSAVRTLPDTTKSKST